MSDDARYDDLDLEPLGLLAQYLLRTGGPRVTRALRARTGMQDIDPHRIAVRLAQAEGPRLVRAIRRGDDLAVDAGRAILAGQGAAYFGLLSSDPAVAATVATYFQTLGHAVRHAPGMVTPGPDVAGGLRQAGHAFATLVGRWGRTGRGR